MNSPAQTLAIRPAATVAVVRDSDAERALEVLLLRRNRELAFAAGAWVFPGGALESGERPLAAALRECQEECGLQLSASALVEYAHWTTPATGMRRRFATHFYCAQVATQSEIAIDQSEIHDYRWLTPAAALSLHRQGELEMMPPTYLSLRLFAGFSRSAELLAALRAVAPYVVEPKIVRAERGLVSLYPGDCGFSEGQADAPGAQHRCWFTAEGLRYQHSGADVGVRAMDHCD
ncbi:NUDIX hydrolase [Gammaproteobacteria bacterium LSUCC0057]|uniref:NUDIX hydrolase n=1 Tax=Gammaproteobacteria bacterium LSUCC0057 TaxID=2559237 RepID=A0A4Y8UI11_9GAMM|nr:NUDIX hydrolase [Gammaproteobacteria bacterium LSUCC0057]